VSRAAITAMLLALALTLSVDAGGRGGRRSPPPGSVLLRDGFSHPNGPNQLIANEWAYWNRWDPERIRSTTWAVTSGSLFSVDGVGWTGVPDDRAPDRYSETGTDSQVFRLHTVRGDFGNVEQAVDVRINGFAHSAKRPAHPWDGVVLWPRFVSPFHLYFAYLLRKDGRVEITKKCPGRIPGGSYYNRGSYFTLAPGRPFRPTIVGRWYHLASAVQDNPNGSVTIRVFRGGVLAAAATDHGVGCPPIRGQTHLGIRADNVDANFAGYIVTELSAFIPSRCPGSLVGATREAELRDAEPRRTRRCP
jgi:hypothetical protein